MIKLLDRLQNICTFVATEELFVRPEERPTLFAPDKCATILALFKVQCCRCCTLNVSCLQACCQREFEKAFHQAATRIFHLLNKTISSLAVLALTPPEESKDAKDSKEDKDGKDVKQEKVRVPRFLQVICPRC